MKGSGNGERKVDYNDIDLTHWKDYDFIETDSLWLISARERGHGHSLDYHGNFVPQIATQVFQRYTKKGDTILDLFLGSGTSMIEALRLERRCIGVELKGDLIQYVTGKIPPEGLGQRALLIEGDSAAEETKEKVRAALGVMGQDRVQLVILHPPYHDIIKFSEHPQDLANAATTEEFLDLFSAVAANGYELLEPGRFAAVVIGDKYSQGQLVPLGFMCMQRMNQVGFLTKALVVKNIEGNEIGKGRTNNLWRYRALAGGFYIFKHEYVIILQKPPATPRQSQLLRPRRTDVTSFGT